MMSTFPLPLYTPITPELIHGAVELERTQVGLLPHRLPVSMRAQCQDAQLAMAESQPAGVRLVCQTAATVLELVVLPTKRVYVGMAPRPPGMYDLLVDGRLTHQESAREGWTLNIDIATGAATVVPADPQTLRFDGLGGGSKTIEIWLPHDATTELVALRSDAPIVPAPATVKRKGAVCVKC
jgi:hypothetical protein